MVQKGKRDAVMYDLVIWDGVLVGCFRRGGKDMAGPVSNDIQTMLLISEADS